MPSSERSNFGVRERRKPLKNRFGIVARLALLFAVFPAAPSRPSVQQPGEPPKQVVQVTAVDFEFLPSTIHVKAGTRVELRVTSNEGTHGLRISHFAEGVSAKSTPGLIFENGMDCWKLKKGVTVTVEFVAQGPGTYAIVCCKRCGSGHKGMKGRLIVDP